MSLGTDVEEDVGVTELYLSIPRDWMLCRLVTVDVVNEDDVIRYYSLALFLPLREDKDDHTSSNEGSALSPLPNEVMDKKRREKERKRKREAERVSRPSRHEKVVVFAKRFCVNSLTAL